MKPPITTDIIIIGAGAAGLLCAIESGKRGRSVIVFEHNDKVGKKIRISGGGRCNFTNINTASGNYISQNPHFAKSALARYTPQHFCALVRFYKIPFHEKKLGQLFCDESAQNIIDLLKDECAKYNVKIVLGIKVTRVSKTEIFTLETTEGTFECQNLVIASGGLSIPTLGASSFGYTIAQQFGLNVTPCRPGLVPLTMQAKDLKVFQTIAGVSVDTIASFKNISFRENILFTHRGLSGPAILQISSYWQPGEAIHINLLPDVKLLEILKSRQKEKVTLQTLLKEYLPNRLVEIFCACLLDNRPLNQYSPKEMERIAETLHDWQIIPQGTEGYAKAEVTVGGVDTDELSSKTMEAKKSPGLFFIGEAVDMTGHLGGFNFQWAWASGYAAGQYA